MENKDLESQFELFCRNRQALCDSDGKLYRKNIKYRKKFVELGQKVASLTAAEAQNRILHLRLPNSELGEQCKQDIEELMSSMSPQFVDIIKKGTYQDLLSQIDAFVLAAERTYKEYQDKGMEVASGERNE